MQTPSVAELGRFPICIKLRNNFLTFLKFPVRQYLKRQDGKACLLRHYLTGGCCREIY